MRSVHVVVPEGIDDPAHRSGGNVYDRRLCDGLRQLGWKVHEHALPGAWPSPGACVRASLAATLAPLADGALVMLDGLIASGAPQVLGAQASRLRLVVLVHLPLGVDDPTADPAMGECAVLSAAGAVITTSDWTRRWLIASYGLDQARVHVAEPGVDQAPAASGTAHGGELLCVAAVVPHKGQDLLLAALCRIPELSWRCACVGSTTRDPEFAARLVADVEAAGASERFALSGNRWGADLDAAYATADVLVLPSRMETYGLVVTEALARAVPVIAADVGGVRQALGDDGHGNRPGLLVPPGDVDALAGALRRWLIDADLRSGLRRAAAARRLTLRRWSHTAEAVSRVLERR